MTQGQSSSSAYLGCRVGPRDGLGVVSYKWAQVTGPAAGGLSTCRRATVSVSCTDRAIKAQQCLLPEPLLWPAEGSCPKPQCVAGWDKHNSFSGEWVTIHKQHDSSGRKEIRAHLILFVQMSNVRPRKGM